MELYIARHGQSRANVQGLVCGCSESPLTNVGIEQAKALAKSIAGSGIRVDAFFCSPLERARMTAAIVSDAVGISPIIEPRIIEQCYGSYEMTGESDEFFRAKGQFANRFGGGESMLDVAHRVYGFFDELKQRYSDKTVLLICHGAVMRVMNTYFNDISNEDFPNFRTGNCELRHYSL